MAWLKSYFNPLHLYMWRRLPGRIKLTSPMELTTSRITQGTTVLYELAWNFPPVLSPSFPAEDLRLGEGFEIFIERGCQRLQQAPKLLALVSTKIGIQRWPNFWITCPSIHIKQGQRNRSTVGMQSLHLTLRMRRMQQWTASILSQAARTGHVSHP